MPQLEFDIWGSIPFSQELTSDPIVQQILLATRTKAMSLLEIANSIEADRRHVSQRIDELARWDLLVADKSCPGRWVGNLPVYTAADMAVSEEIGSKYAKIEADILSSSLPSLQESYESCEISRRFPWESMSLIVVGALLADLCVYDRVRFFPQYLREDYLPPLHPDGRRWGYAGYERRRPRFPLRRLAFCQNLNLEESETGGLATFSYFDPPAERQAAPRSLFDQRLRSMVFCLAEARMSVREIAATTSVNAHDVQRTLEDWASYRPPAVCSQGKRYSLNIPVFPCSDLRRLLHLADAVAETIHTEVTLPWHEERQETAEQMGLRFPLAESHLARDMALQVLVEEGRLSEVPDPPVPWSFGVWGWQGELPLWEDATREKEGT